MLLKRLVAMSAVALLFVLAAGCAQPRPVLNKLNVDIEKKEKGQLLSIYPTDRSTLKEVNLNVNVIFEDGNSRAFKKYFATWDETRTIEIPVLTKIEKVQVSGNAVRIAKGPDGAVQVQPVDIMFERSN